MNGPPSKSREYFERICRIMYIMGARDYWFEGQKFPYAFKLCHIYYSNIAVVAMIVLIVSQWGVYFTDQKMTEKQRFDSNLFAIGHTVATGMAMILESHLQKIIDLVKRLTVDLKGIYNDEFVEKGMIAASRVYLKYYTIMMFMSLFLNGVEGYIQVLKGHTFVTLVTAWPHVEDTSTLASIGRVGVFIIWIVAFTRMASSLIIVLPLSICLSYQYKNLRSYFDHLNDIFEEQYSQKEKDIKYEKALRVGIQLHSETFNCVKQFEIVFNAVYGGQIIMKSSALMALMASMVNVERTFSNVVVILCTAIYALISLGFLVLSAGNISEEAEYLPSAIFNSGWQNCSKKTVVRMKPLIIFSILMSQRPVELKCLGTVPLSYQSYVTIVKSCYSGFSVLY